MKDRSTFDILSHGFVYCLPFIKRGFEQDETGCFSWEAGLYLCGVTLQSQSPSDKLRISQAVGGEDNRCSWVPSPMDTPYQAACPQIGQDCGDESPGFSNLNGVPTTSSFHVPGHLQSSAVNTKLARKSRGMVIPNPHLLRSPLGFCRD